MTDHIVEVPKKVLSPTAQKVLRAATAPTGDFCLENVNEIAAAALRELADQVVCADPTGAPDCCISIMEEIRADILAIATELEDQ